ncbi:hypothetical protein HZR84_03415 [Hyphobacterium sp. CCMP332]|nr:hypothetical protein HZR84_03415 [Hyphobacterium sp. CCMP332]
MKRFYITLISLLFIFSNVLSQSHLEWQLNGTDVTTTIQSDNAAPGGTPNSNLPAININWNYADTEISTTHYRNFQIKNEGFTGGLKFKYSGNNSTYTNIIGLGPLNLDVYGGFVTHNQSTFKDNATFEDDILMLNSKISIGETYADINIGSHKFQVKGSSNLIGDLNVQQNFSVSNLSTFNGISRHENNVEIRESNYLEFGYGVEKEVNAGKIGYQIWTPNLDIVGAGEEVGERQIRLWDKVTIGNRNNGPHSDAELHVNGKIAARRVIVTAHNWSDYVFEDGYELRNIQELDDYIKENGHLPNIPSTKEVMESGVDVADMNRLLLEKIEELTLYVIDLQGQIEDLGK